MKSALQIIMAVVAISVAVAAIVNHKQDVFTLGEESADWKPVCVHGQLVYRANLVEKGMAVNALTPEGKPVACNE